jgi:hypothetical protein
MSNAIWCSYHCCQSPRFNGYTLCVVHMKEENRFGRAHYFKVTEQLTVLPSLPLIPADKQKLLLAPPAPPLQ